MQRAAEAWRASAAPAVVELHELALREIELAEPQTPRTDDQSDADAERPIVTVDDALAAVEQVQDEIDDVVFTIRDLLVEVDDSIAAIRDAVSPEAAEAALQRFVDAANALTETRPRFRPAVWGWTLWIPPEVHTEEVEAAIQAVRRKRIRDDIPEWVTERKTAITAEDFAYDGVSVGRNRAEGALKGTAAVFVVADASGMAAFRTSLSESCQP